MLIHLDLRVYPAHMYLYIFTYMTLWDQCVHYQSRRVNNRETDCLAKEEQ